MLSKDLARRRTQRLRRAVRETLRGAKEEEALRARETGGLRAELSMIPQDALSCSPRPNRAKHKLHGPWGGKCLQAHCQARRAAKMMRLVAVGRKRGEGRSRVVVTKVWTKRCSEAYPEPRRQELPRRVLDTMLQDRNRRDVGMIGMVFLLSDDKKELYMTSRRPVHLGDEKDRVTAWYIRIMTNLDHGRCE